MQPDRRDQRSQHWTLDKKIQLPLLFVLISQVVAGIWFAAMMVSKIDIHEKEIIRIQGSQSEIRMLSDKIIRLEVLLENINAKVDTRKR